MSEDCTHDNIGLRYAEFGNLIMVRASDTDYDVGDSDAPYGYHVIDAWCEECDKVFNAKETLELLKQTSLAEAVYKLNIEMLQQSKDHRMKYVTHQTLGRLTKGHYRRSVKESDPIEDPQCKKPTPCIHIDTMGYPCDFCGRNPERVITDSHADYGDYWETKETDKADEYRERFSVVKDGELWKLLISGFRLPTHIVWDGVKGDVFVNWGQERYFQIGTVSHDEEDTQEDGLNYAFHEIKDTYSLSVQDPEGRWTLNDVLEEMFEELDDLVNRHAVYNFPKKHPCDDPSPCRFEEHYANTQQECEACSRHEGPVFGTGHFSYGDHWEAKE